MKISITSIIPFLIGVIVLSFCRVASAHKNDSLGINSKTENVSPLLPEETLAIDYQTIKTIVPHLMEMQGQVIVIRDIIVNYNKVEKLWGFYEEAKRDGSIVSKGSLVKELSFSTKYTLYLLDTALDKILPKLNNEDLRIALVDWKQRKTVESKLIYQKDENDLDRLKKMKPKVMENPTLTNTTKLATLIRRRDSLFAIQTNSKRLSEYRRNQIKKIEEVDLFYSCDLKKRKTENAPENIMEFKSDKAIQIIQLDREIYQFRPVSYTHLTLPTIYSV